MWAAIKFWFVWAIATTLVALFILLSQMYARESTLDGVRDVEFDLVFNYLVDSSDNQENDFKAIADQISLKNKSVVLFPLALLSQNHCINNGPRDAYNSLCKKFNGISDWKEKREASNGSDSATKSYASYLGHEYAYRRVSTDYLLIGKAGDYRPSRPWYQKFWYFLSTRVANYYLGNIGGLYGFKKMISKGMYTLIFFISASFLATFFYRSRIRSIQKKYKSRVLDLEASLKENKTETASLIGQLSEIGSRISDLQSENEDLRESGLLESDEKQSQIDELNSIREDIEEKLLLKELENIELKNKITDQAANLNRKELEKKYKDTKRHYDQLTQLWGTSINWEDRLNIEDTVSDLNRFPFTVSMAFIAFEEHIAELYRNKFPNGELTELKARINEITKDSLEARPYLDQYRRARNAWVHNSVMPSVELIRDLLRLINKHKANV